MATERFLVCTACVSQEYAGPLFDALKAAVNDSVPLCKCGTKRYLKLIFPFAFSVTPHACRVVRAFLPDQPPSWPDGTGDTVTFYPFLVICESLDAEMRKTAWMPYWHGITSSGNNKPKMKYGQWAPHMDSDILDDLVQQARKVRLLI